MDRRGFIALLKIGMQELRPLVRSNPERCGRICQMLFVLFSSFHLGCGPSDHDRSSTHVANSVDSEWVLRNGPLQGRRGGLSHTFDALGSPQVAAFWWI